MTIYFAFSDESGSYKEERNHRFNQRHPYYIRASFIINGDAWQYLERRFWQLKKEYDIPQEGEVKYSDLWRIQEYQSHPEKGIESRLKDLCDYPIEALKAFIYDAINLLHEIEQASIIITVTKNDWCGIPNEKDIYTWHIQTLMQRIQKDLESPEGSFPENLCLIFIDPTASPKVNKLLTDIYNELFIKGDRFTTFSTIKDCLHFELSHHSCGIQIADYIAGITGGYLQGGEYSVNVFNRRIRSLIRCSPNGKTMGYGIIEIPTERKERIRVRKFLSEKFCVE
jgi:Protein of unknown function (DUF3800)